jgi:3-hydroxyisobutyrate dehydrogenase
MSGSINHLGPAGSGAMMKLINNFLCGVQVASLAEAIAMAERSGLDVRQAAAVLAGGARAVRS